MTSEGVYIYLYIQIQRYKHKRDSHEYRDGK